MLRFQSTIFADLLNSERNAMSNQKVLFSQELLHQALLALLKEKPLNKITVRELCAKAGVNRTTFYNHYQSTEDILRELVQQYTFSLSKLFASPDHTFFSVITHVLELMERSRDQILPLMQALPGAYLSESILALPQVDLQLTQALEARGKLAYKEELRTFILAGSSKLITDWLEAPSRRPATEEAKLILDFCGKLL